MYSLNLNCHSNWYAQSVLNFKLSLNEITCYLELQDFIIKKERYTSLGICIYEKSYE